MDAKYSPYLHAHNRISNSAILKNNCFVTIEARASEGPQEWSGHNDRGRTVAEFFNSAEKFLAYLFFTS